MAQQYNWRNGLFPSIHPNYWLGGEKSKINNLSSSDGVFMSRAQKIEDAETHFARAYEAENGRVLPKEACGLVCIQLGMYPFGREIYLNPTLQSKCAKMAMDMDRPVRREYVFVSRSYYLQDGKIEPLLDATAVLYARSCAKVAVKLREKMQWSVFEDLGNLRIKTGDDFYPYWVWLVGSERNRQYLLMSVMNGGVFLLDKLPEQKPCEERFWIGPIAFLHDNDAWRRC